MGSLRIVSHSEEPFINREEAGRLLAKELEAYADQDTVVLGIPRGGIVVAREVARILNAEFDIILARKLGAPGNPELAIGAVSEDGTLLLDEDLSQGSGPIGELAGYVEDEREKQYTLIAESIDRFRRGRKRSQLEGRAVIVTDDGLATGATMQASLRTVRKSAPRRLIAAVPVGSMEALDRVAAEADEAVVLKAPPVFYAVSQFYEYYEQVSDEEVVTALDLARRAGAPVR
ncbi:MAG: phosphoribosyltransferase family protein [Desulfomonilia bacterium]|jgi:putative phosphoribosyl transferase